MNSDSFPMAHRPGRTSLLGWLPIALLAWMVLAAAGTAGSARAETTAGSGAVAITSIPATGLQITQQGTYYLLADLAINADIAYAISITTDNVTLDLNGHTLSQLYTSDNGTIGIYVNANNVTVRNGTLTGFLYGAQTWGDHALIENLALQATTYVGIQVSGVAPCVRHCRVSNIGGETVPNLAPYAAGISVSGGSDAEVSDCDVTTLTPGPGCYTMCISAGYATNILVLNNRLSLADKGCQFVYSSGAYRDNICGPVFSVAYDVIYDSTVTDAGNNQ